MTTTTATASKKVTRTCQDTPFTTARVITALEKTWTAIQAHHTELPAVVVIVASGTFGRHPKWGHFAALRWQHGTAKLPEILIAGEGLNRSVHEVLATLLHEAAHALAHVRGIKDTSRQGRWHNKKFAKLADELGLDTARDDTIGWSLTIARDATVATYQPVLGDLEKALTAWRHPEDKTTATRTSSNNGGACLCGCEQPRRIRAAKAVLDAGPITCGVCGDDFTSHDEGESS